MPFFHFDQNNSGGSFSFDAKRGITHHVIIEADNHEEANDRAESIGIYFNGCGDGRDCPCCGDRWYRKWLHDKGTERPSIYTSDVTDGILKKTKWGMSFMGNNEEGFIHYKDGSIVSVFMEE